MKLLNPLALLPLLLTQPLLHASEHPTFVSKKITPAYVAGNSDVTHVVHTPDSERAVYVQSTDGTKTGTLYSVLLTGGNPVPLLHNVSGEPDYPGFQLTPDGTRVVASSGTTLYSVPVTGGTATPLIDDLAGYYNSVGTPAFTISPDSQTVATVALPPTPQFWATSIFTVPVTGGDPVNISGTHALGGWIEFSADSQTVYFNGVHNETTLPPAFFYQAPADGSVPAEPIVSEQDPGPGPPWPSEGGHSPVLLPDGSGLIYIGAPNGINHLDVRIIDLATRTASTLAPAGPQTVTEYNFSHDASHLLVIRGHFGGSLETVNLATRTVTTLLSSGTHIHTPILSPDGSTVVYHDGERILAQPPAGGPVTDLTFTEVIDLDATKLVGITPDNSRVVFLATIDESGPAQLFSNTLDNTALKRITNTIPEGRYLRNDPFITADGSHVIYRADLYYPGDDYLFKAPTVGGGSTLLHHSTVPARDVDAVLETPDGTGVTFIADLFQNSVDELFHRPYADAGNNQLRLSQPGFGSGDGRLSLFTLTPDSEHAVFRAEARTPGVNELFATSTTGGPAWRLNQDLVISGDVRGAFAFTPDGTHVVYSADADTNKVTELYITSISNPGDHLKLHPDLSGNQDVSRFAVSPDNVHIAVRGDFIDGATHNLYLVKRDGTDLTQLNPPLANGRDVGQFLFSPDGAHIAFLSAAESEPNNNNALFLYNVATGDLQDVLLERDPTLALPSDPRFSPDGKTLLFRARNSINLTRVFLAPVDSTSVISTNIAPTGDAVSRQSRFTSDGDFLVARDLSFENLVAIPVNGSPFRPLDSPNLRAQYFEVAPNTGHVVAVYGLAPQYTLVSIPIDGSDAKTLHVHDGHQQPYGPIVTSADGRRALFTIGNILHVAPLAGPGEIEPVARDLELDPAFPTYIFSPDAGDIYFIARTAGSEDPYSLYNFSYDHDQLTLIATPPGLEPATLTLTPDGRQAIYVAAADTPGVRDIYATHPAVRHTIAAEAATQDTVTPGFVDTTAQTVAFADAAQPSGTGLRFPSIKVEPGTRVHSAHITFTAASSTGASREILIDHLAAPDTPPFVHGPGFDIIDRRDARLNVVSWRVGPWTGGTTQTSPDLTPFFDQLFSIEGWQPFNAAGFLMFSRSGTGDPHTVHLSGPTPPQLEITILGDIRRGQVERTTFAAWAAARGIGADPASDDDLDNVPLLVEYAFDLDPTRADAPPAPIIFFSAADNGDFAPTVTYVHPPSRTSTDLTLESSTDLRTWTPIAVTKAGANTIALGDAFVSELAFPENFLTAQVSLPVVTEQTATVHFRFRVSFAQP